MSVLVHLSDLHLRAEASAARRALLDGLVAAVEREHLALGRPRALLAITGDVFDSATDDRDKVVPMFLDLLGRLVDALGGAATIVLPGNHDRRRAGMLGPQRPELFRALFDAVDPDRVFVAGCRTPFLAEIVPTRLHGVDAYGPGTAFEWIGLLCRYGATEANLTLLRDGAGELEPFVAVTDLSTGRERPAPLEPSSDAWTLRVGGCPARTLLRIYWPLRFD